MITFGTPMPETNPFSKINHFELMLWKANGPPMPVRSTKKEQRI